MAKPKKTDEDHIAEYFRKLDHPLKDVVEALRQMILIAGKEIREQIKWNSLSFYYAGAMKPFDPKEYKRDIVVFNLHKKDFVLLVFPTGAKINDKTGFLEGSFTDGRRVAKITNPEDAKKKEKDLKGVIKQWIELVDK